MNDDEIEIARFQHAEPLALAERVLGEAGIRFRVSSDALTADASALGQSSVTSSILMVPAEQVIAARTVLLEEARKEVAAAPDDTHVLASYADDELREVLTQPQDWSEYDLAVAEHLLKKRGIEPPPVVFTVPVQPKEPAPELASGDEEPDEGSHQVKPVIVGAGFVLGTMAGVGHVLMLAGLGGFVIAFAIMLSTERGADGRKRYYYNARSRTLGLWVFCYAFALFLVRMVFTLYF